MDSERRFFVLYIRILFCPGSICTRILGVGLDFLQSYVGDFLITVPQSSGKYEYILGEMPIQGKWSVMQRGHECRVIVFREIIHIISHFASSPKFEKKNCRIEFHKTVFLHTFAKVREIRLKILQISPQYFAKYKLNFGTIAPGTNTYIIYIYNNIHIYVRYFKT